MNIPEPVYIVLFLTFSGLIIRTCLVIVGQTWSKTYHYLGTYILLPNIAYVVTTVIANNIALSLGMIGALSIVRFRHPVRSHFELTMFFALITLGIAAGVNIKFAILLLSIIIATIFGIEIIQKVAEKFGLNLYQLSFSEGISNYIVELSSSEKIDEIDSNDNLINSFFSKSDKQWEYKLVFKSKKEMDDFVNKISSNNKIITYKTSSAIS
tara:strand:+ start:1748 stop:2380 length:633 start_codon:yes stop_codon:yes gene_type:complete